jgi:uncharacterized protein (UPF0332 family)
LGRTLNEAYDKRLGGDYGVGVKISKKDAKDLLDTSQNFVQKLKGYLKTWIETGEEC